MQLYFRRILAVSLAGCAMSGCVSVAQSTAKPYQAPDPRLPSAQLIVFPSAPSMLTRDSESLERRDLQCQPNGSAKTEFSQLAKFTRWSRLNEAVEVAVPAGRVSFLYEKVKDKSVCAIRFSAELAAGHSYALKMQEKFQGWLKGTDCVLVMLDTATGEAVRLESDSMQGETAQASNCRKAAQP